MLKADERITLKYGAGGRAMRSLIRDVLTDGLLDAPVDGIGLAAFDDGAALRVGDRWLGVTTDSHVVQPPFFPGGDIGRLAVAGTVNDLAMMGLNCLEFKILQSFNPFGVNNRSGLLRERHGQSVTYVFGRRLSIETESGVG